MSQNIKEIKKRDLLLTLYDRVIDDLSNVSFEADVKEDQVEYYDDLGNSPDENGFVTVRVQSGPYIMEDEGLDIEFLNYVRIDDLPSGELSKSQIEDWFNEGVGSFCYSCTALYVGGHGSEQEPLYMQVDRLNYKLEELNSEWSDEKFHIDDESLSSFRDEVLGF